MTPMADVAVDLLLKATLVLSAGWLMTRVMVRASAASRHAVWAAVCIAALALPVTRSLTPTLLVEWWPVSDRAGHTQPISVAVDANATAPGDTDTRGNTSDMSPSRAWMPWLVVVWLAGIVVVLARLWIGRRVTAALERRSRPMEDPRVLSRSDVVAGWFGGTKLTVLEGPADCMPATWGTQHPVLVLPPSVREWSDARLDTVLVHELAHVRRRDAWWQQVAQVTAAVWWMHPMAWMLVRQMRVERECACDDMVLAFGARATDYATDLVVMVGECGDADIDATATLAMARRSQLEGRVMAILNPNVNRDGRTAVASVLAAGLVLAMVPLAGLRASSTPQASTDAVQAPVEPMQQQALRVGDLLVKEPKKIHHVDPIYPDIARSARVQGVVIIEVRIDGNGDVEDAKVLRPVALLDQAALDAVRQWRFSPTHLNGVPVPLMATVTVAFRLDDEGNPVQATPSPAPIPLDAPATRPTPAAAPTTEAPPVEWDGVSPLRIGGTIKEPKKIKHVNPVYPPEARESRVQGIVIIEAVIGADGLVESAKVLRPVALLDQAAVDAVMQWEFLPTTLNGQPVPVIMTVTVNFSLY